MDNITGGQKGERATGTPNTIYDLSSVLFHALEGGASYDTYIEDAEREGDQELADFFRRVRDEDSVRADDAQQLLAERTPTATTTTSTTTVEPVEGATAPSEGLATGAPRREESSPRTESVLPGEGAVTGDVPGGVPPRTEEAAPLRREDVGQPEREREEDKGLLDRAKEAITGEDEPRREGSREAGRDDPLSGRP